MKNKAITKERLTKTALAAQLSTSRAAEPGCFNSTVPTSSFIIARWAKAPDAASNINPAIIRYLFVIYIPPRI